MRVGGHVRMCMHTCGRACAYVHACVWKGMHACGRACACVHACVCIHTCACAYARACACEKMCNHTWVPACLGLQTGMPKVLQRTNRRPTWVNHVWMQVLYPSAMLTTLDA